MFLTALQWLYYKHLSTFLPLYTKKMYSYCVQEICKKKLPYEKIDPLFCFFSEGTMKKSFYDQLEDEKIHFVFGQHWLLALLRILIFGVLIVATAVLPFFFVKYFFSEVSGEFIAHFVLLASFFLGTLLIHRLFLWFLSYRGTFAIVTNFRIIIVKKSMFFTSEKEVLDLTQIRDIQMRKNGIFNNICNCGDINLILSTQEKDATVIRKVFDPMKIQSQCNAIRHQKIQETNIQRNGGPYIPVAPNKGVIHHDVFVERKNTVYGQEF